MTAKVALLVSDIAPTRELSERLAQSGYYIEFAYSGEAALERVAQRAPTCAVVGPLAPGEAVLALLDKLEQLRIDTIVISREPAIVAAASRHGMQLQTPAS